MKVVLLSDVKGLGKKGELVNAADGYARNFLFPKMLAKQANAQALNEIKNAESAKLHRLEIERKLAQDNFDKINERTIRISAKAGEKGNLFGSVTTRDIADKLSEEFKVSADKRKITIEDGEIKKFGTYSCDVRLHKDVTAKIFVVVGEK